MTWLSLLAGEAFAWLGLGLATGWLDIAHGELEPVDLLYTLHLAHNVLRVQ